MIVLGIETSCDDTAVGLWCDERRVLSSVMATQLEHREFGGVVPELASRVHLKNLPWVLRAALEDASLSLEDVDAIAVTEGPGLLGSLLVGTAFAQSLGASRQRPVIGVHHIEAHILANQLEADMVYPSLALIVSGGHSQIILLRRCGEYELLATTRDDAAGEAYDKVAKVLDLGFPGGPIIEKRARLGDEKAIPFPRTRLGDGQPGFSFSGLKTAARLRWEKITEPGEQELNDFCASFQKAVIVQLLGQIEIAVRGRDIRACYLAGGVAANRALLSDAIELLDPLGIPVLAPAPRYCTDNGVMVACAGATRLALGDEPRPLSPFSRGVLGN